MNRRETWSGHLGDARVVEPDDTQLSRDRDTLLNRCVDDTSSHFVVGSEDAGIVSRPLSDVF